MLTDHIGYIFFPDIQIFRIIGRLAFPIFAFMIAEGCFYTKNKLRYFICIFVLGVLCQSVYGFFAGEGYLNILLTFSLSVLTIFSLQRAISGHSIGEILPLLFTVSAVYLLNIFFVFDYGFWGCMTPVFAAFFHKSCYKRIFTFGVGLLLLWASLGGLQGYSLLAMLLLFLYSGKRGKMDMKYFFYLFYPLHLAVLYGIYVVLQ